MKPTETKINLCGIEITLRQVTAGLPAMIWDAMRYRHNVTIEINDISKHFDYHGSVNDYNEGKDRLSKEELKDVLECVISDAIAGVYDCKEFFAEFGYDDPCEGLKAYKACLKTLSEFNDMGISEDMLYEMSNELNEAA
jgi:UDP-N-acetylmuramoylalanine-D-glutamate ligase